LDGRQITYPPDARSDVGQLYLGPCRHPASSLNLARDRLQTLRRFSRTCLSFKDRNAGLADSCPIDYVWIRWGPQYIDPERSPGHLVISLDDHDPQTGFRTVIPSRTVAVHSSSNPTSCSFIGCNSSSGKLSDPRLLVSNPRVSQVSMSEVVDGDGEGDEQVSASVTDHRKTRRRNIRERPKWKGTRDRRLHFEYCPTPHRLARHNQAGDNPDRHQAWPITSLSRDLGEGSPLATPASQPHPIKRPPARNCDNGSCLPLALSELTGAAPSVGPTRHQGDQSVGASCAETSSNRTSPSFELSSADSQLRRGTPEDLNRLHLFDSIRGLPAGVFGQQGRRNSY